MANLEVEPLNNDLKVFKVEGFSCANCAGKFEQNVKDLPGVVDAKVNFGASKISVSGQATVAELEEAGAFENLKIEPDRAYYEQVAQEVEEKEREPFYKKYSQLLYAILLIASGFISSYINGGNNLVTILLFLSSILISGLDLFKVGLKNLFQLDFDMKTLMTVASIGGALIGEWGEVAVVVVLFAISEELEAYSMDKARQSISSLIDLAPNQALVRRNGQELQIPVAETRVGDIMLVHPGDKIAMDGQVADGHSAVNQAAITGESVPVAKEVGDEVFAGTLNEEGFLEVEITKKVEDTTLARIIHLVEEAQGEKAPSQAFVDKFAKYYTPAIMLIALLVALVPPLFFGADWLKWIYQGLAVLLVGCPCALVISTPISIVSAIGNAAKKGVLIKGGIHLEELGKVEAIAFDKTGTLTEGHPSVTDYELVDSQLDEDQVLTIISAIESRSQHPLARAIVNYADEKNLVYNQLEVEDFQSLTGQGIKGQVDEKEYVIGSPKFFRQSLGLNFDSSLDEKIDSLQNQGKTTILIGQDNQVLAYIALADQVRQSSQKVIQDLHEMGINHTIMLTGDNQGTAQAIGQEVGVSDIEAELMPEDKLNRIKALQEDYQGVAMVGDGVNDAPALAAATVGIAMGGAGTDTALETADIALMADDLSKLPFTIKLSRKTLNTIKANITFALAIKAIALLLVIPGWLTLWIAILSDTGATLLVALNSLRLMRVEE